MLTLELPALLLATLGLFLAGIVKGATGLGYASCALPFLAVSIGLKPAMALVIVPAMATNVSLAVSTGHLWETLIRFKPLYLAMLPGIVLGVHLLTVVSAANALQLLGLVVMIYVAIAIAKPQLSLPARLQLVLQVPTGFLNGVMTGLTGAQVMPLFPYMMALNLDAGRTLQAINIAVLIGSAILGAGLFAAGIMTLPLLGLSVLAAAPALFGVALGEAARHRIPLQAFRRLSLLTLFLMGGLMLAR